MATYARGQQVNDKLLVVALPFKEWSYDDGLERQLGRNAAGTVVYVSHAFARRNPQLVDRYAGEDEGQRVLLELWRDSYLAELNRGRFRGPAYVRELASDLAAA